MWYLTRGIKVKVMNSNINGLVRGEIIGILK